MAQINSRLNVKTNDGYDTIMLETDACLLTGITDIENGGTGGSTTEEARRNLNVPPTSHASTSTTYGISTSTNYGHAMSSSATPLMDGIATAGTDNGNFAREGHRHPSDTSKANVSHTQSASTISSGTFTGKVLANATTVATVANKQIRNIYAGTTDMTSGTTTLTSGDIYIMYE
jgi:hypothetical protein